MFFIFSFSFIILHQLIRMVSVIGIIFTFNMIGGLNFEPLKGFFVCFLEIFRDWLAILQRKKS